MLYPILCTVTCPSTIFLYNQHINVIARKTFPTVSGIPATFIPAFGNHMLKKNCHKK